MDNLITFVVVTDSSDNLTNMCNLYSTTLFGDKSLNFIIFDRCADNISTTSSMLKNLPNVRYIEKSMDNSICDCYNESLVMIDSEYVCFTNENVFYDYVSINGFNISASRYPDAQLISLDYKVYAENAPINKFTKRFELVSKDLNKFKKLYTFLPAYLIKTSCINDLRFSNVCDEETAFVFLMNLFARYPQSVHIVNACCRYTGAISLRSDEFYGCNNKDFYINSLKENYLPLVKSFTDNNLQVPLWLQRLVYYRLYFKFYSNFNARNRFLVDGEDIDKFFVLSSQLLSVVDDKLILDNTKYQQFAPPLSIRNLFVYLKYNGDINKLDRSFSLKDGKLFFNQCGCRYNLSPHLNLEITAFNIRNNNLCIDARYFTHLLYDYDPQSISVQLNGKSYPLQKTNLYSHDKIFSVSIEKHYTFFVEFPLEEVLKDGSNITFYITLDGTSYKLPLLFYRAPSKLNENCPNSYWNIADDYYFVYEGKSLVVKAFNKKELKKREKLFVKEAGPSLYKLKYTTPVDIKQLKKQAKKLRKAYFANKKSFANRRIWIYFDKLYKAGDNGEYAFRYAVNNSDNIECYYVINSDSPDYKRLHDEFPDNILVYGTLKCQLYGLLAENIVATHPDIIQFIGIDSYLTTVVKDLFNANLICIAHGITIQKNADYQNRLYDNTMFYTTSSKYEVNHILNPIYGYREDEVALTGLARFDGLKNNDKKQILITPTWRRNLVGSATRNSTREYSDLFKQTDYYKIYNSLINDKRIIDVAKSTGYKIIFLLHPSMSAQIDDYDRNDYVQLLQASGDMSYEKILTESSLMVTDYSGIHYDFGYMRKPIIYYQPKEVPMRFEEGGMKFATMAFGPVCTLYEDAVRLICEYMENSCVMPDEYKKRADDFFAFDDYNSSQRIYDAILKWTNERK